MSDDRREQNRVQSLIDVIWEGASGRYESRTSDINSAGCFVDSIAQVDVGDIITFKLCLPSEGSIEVQGEVVYVFPNTGFGVRFTDMSEEDRRRLEWLVKAESHRFKNERG